MTPHKAINKLHKRYSTLEGVRAALGKSGVKTSVATLWRIKEKADHATSYRLASSIIKLEESTRKSLAA